MYYIIDLLLCLLSGSVKNILWKQFTFSDLNCENNEEYKFHTLTCQPSCGNLNPQCKSYTEGCVCKPDYVLSSTKCVKKGKCGCFYKGRYLQVSIVLVCLFSLSKLITVALPASSTCGHIKRIKSGLSEIFMQSMITGNHSRRKTLNYNVWWKIKRKRFHYVSQRCSAVRR